MRAHPPCHAGPAAQDPLVAARSGEHPGVLAKLRSGYLVIADAQFLPGYCVLVAEGEHAQGRPPEQLADLPQPARTRFLTELGLLGEALAAACAAWDPAFSRVDYDIHGNQWRQLHAHVYPRYAWEPVELRDGPVWWHPAEVWTDPAHTRGPAHERLVELITRELSRVLAEAY